MRGRLPTEWCVYTLRKLSYHLHLPQKFEVEKGPVPTTPARKRARSMVSPQQVTQRKRQVTMPKMVAPDPRPQGWPSDGESEESHKRLQADRTASRCFVYNLRNYTRETLWGPYTTNGDGKVTVNWEHLEHIMNVVVMNVREVPNHWEEVWPTWGLESTRAYSAPHVRNRNPNDWAGVEGVWRRVVCFMDYR